jgi:hypothetical protein
MCVLGSLWLAAEGSILCRLKENVGGSVKRPGCVTYSVRHVSRLQRCYSLHHNLLEMSSDCCECKELEQECKMVKLSLKSDIATPEGDSVIAVRARDAELSHQITWSRADDYAAWRCRSIKANTWLLSHLRITAVGRPLLDHYRFLSSPHPHVSLQQSPPCLLPLQTAQIRHSRCPRTWSPPDRTHTPSPTMSSPPSLQNLQPSPTWIPCPNIPLMQRQNGKKALNNWSCF